MENALDSHVAAYQGDNRYDSDNEILLTWYPRRVLQYAASAGSLLELGLGHGYATNLFAPRFHRHLVIEGSPAVIRNFRQRHPDCRAQIIQAYFENFSNDERFDVIVLGFILEHVADPLSILHHYQTLLAPGGKMFLAVPNAEVLNRRLGHLAGMLEDMALLSDNDRLLGHKRYYTVDTLTRQVKGAGYRIDRLEGIYLKPFTSAQMLSLKLEPTMIAALCAIGVNYPELCCGILAEISLR